MSHREERKRKPFLILVYWVLVMILFSLLVTATYTWFSISRTPRVSNMGLHINAPSGLVLSTTPEGKEWVQQIDVAELLTENTPLRPVTWSEQDQCFYSVKYGIDGRRTGDYHKLTDGLNANRDDVYGYYIKVSFYATSETDVKLSLTEAVEVNEGIDGAGTYLIGTPIWDSDRILHSDGGQGAQNAIRIGLKFTPLSEGQPQTEQSVFYIYEPNCSTHLDGSEGYTETPSIDGTESLVPAERLICQGTTTWREANVIQRDVVFKTMGEFVTDTGLISLKSQQVVKVDMYIWLEGMDVDCQNFGKDAQIMANIQFFAEADNQSGLDPIPEDE